MKFGQISCFFSKASKTYGLNDPNAWRCLNEYSSLFKHIFVSGCCVSFEASSIYLFFCFNLVIWKNTLTFPWLYAVQLYQKCGGLDHQIREHERLCKKKHRFDFGNIFTEWWKLLSGRCCLVQHRLIFGRGRFENCRKKI